MYQFCGIQCVRNKRNALYVALESELSFDFGSDEIPSEILANVTNKIHSFICDNADKSDMLEVSKESGQPERAILL